MAAENLRLTPTDRNWIAEGGRHSLSRDNASEYKLVHFLLIAAMFPASGDIVFFVSVAGAHVRISQLLQIAAIGLYGALSIQREVLFAPGTVYLFVFFSCCLSFVPNAPFLLYNISYLLSFAICIFSVIVYANYYGRTEFGFYKLVRWYLISCMCVAAFGVVQFVIGTTGHDFLIRQWIIYHRFPREMSNMRKAI